VSEPAPPTTRRAVVTAIALLAATTTVVPIAPARPTATSARVDFNGDGYRDILAGNRDETFGGLKQAGTFAVVPGGPHGPTGAGSRVFSQNSADVPGTAEKGDRFGDTTYLVDGNGDGRAEPVVTATQEDSGAGAVRVFRATSAGATAKGSFAFGARILGTVASSAELAVTLPN
jgi:hypothetical protein